MKIQSPSFLLFITILFTSINLSSSSSSPNSSSDVTFRNLLVSSNNGGGGISEKLWHELGRGIGNENLDDLAGYAVATSGSGYTVAVGSPKHTSLTDPNPDFDAGRVRVYRYDPRQDGWRKIGQDIIGGNTGDQIGQSIALSVDGTLLAIGAPNCMRFDKREVGCVQVYSLETIATLVDDKTDFTEDQEEWLQLGDTIIGEKELDHFGTAIDVQVTYDVIADRETYVVAIGAPDSGGDGQESGIAYVYSFLWEDEKAVQEWKREAIIVDDVPFPLGQFGTALSMTADAKMIAIGAPKYGTQRQGIVRLFRENEEGEWIQVSLPDNLDANQQGESCGSSVSIDPSGQYIAFGCPKANVGTGYEMGKVKILKKSTTFDGTISWSRSEITGEDEMNLFGTAVQLSEVMDGHVFIAIGAPKNSKTGVDLNLIENSGHVRVYYSTDDGDWEQAGLDVDGLKTKDEFGSSVAISKEGHIVMGGAPKGGYAKIFKLDYTAPPTPAPSEANGMNSKELEKKREMSVWIVFIISTFSIISILLTFLFLQRIRDHYARKSRQVVGTSDVGLVELSQTSSSAGFVRPTAPVPTDDSRDII